MKSTTSINLNLQLPNYSVAVYAVQGDTMSREISATLLDGSSPFTPPYGVLGSIRYMKPDGTVGLYDTMEDGATPAVVIDGNVATILLAEQMLTVAGEVLAQLSLYSADSERLSTFTFKVAVEANPYTDEAFESTDYFSVLTADIASILAVVTNMPAPATDLPLMDGTAEIGVKGEFARSDHVHPTDTSRASATDVQALQGAAENKVLYLTSVQVSATTGNIVSVSDAKITTDHVLTECIFADSNVITSDVTWATTDGSFTLVGTCARATTVNVVLVKKDN